MGLSILERDEKGKYCNFVSSRRLGGLGMKKSQKCRWLVTRDSCSTDKQQISRFGCELRMEVCRYTRLLILRRQNLNRNERVCWMTLKCTVVQNNPEEAKYGHTISLACFAQSSRRFMAILVFFKSWKVVYDVQSARTRRWIILVGASR